MQEQLTTLNSVTSRHAESCILKLFGYNTNLYRAAGSLQPEHLNDKI